MATEFNFSETVKKNLTWNYYTVITKELSLCHKLRYSNPWT